jgi:hypothetical protein
VTEERVVSVVRPPHGADSSGWGTWGAVIALVAGGLVALLLAVTLADVEVSGSDAFVRAGYCSVAGNTNADGSALAPGTYLDLVVGEPSRNGRLAGAVPANFVQGSGLTCSGPPAGYVRRGLASDAEHVLSGMYPLYVPAGS